MDGYDVDIFAYVDGDSDKNIVGRNIVQKNTVLYDNGYYDKINHRKGEITGSYQDISRNFDTVT
jgi:hypothetical protein